MCRMRIIIWKSKKMQIEDFIAQKMDVIVIVAVDSYGLTEEVDKAKSEGIRVISYDRSDPGKQKADL